MREIKFRAWDSLTKSMIEDYCVLNETRFEGYDLTNNIHEVIGVMQYTGLKDKNGTFIFEGDIFRIEEETDGEDEVLYVIVVWVQEWTMFCTLRTIGEYQDYLDRGIQALDEPMFWTYTLEDTNSRKHFLCGNLYQNPELLEK